MKRCAVVTVTLPLRLFRRGGASDSMKRNSSDYHIPCSVKQGARMLRSSRAPKALQGYHSSCSVHIICKRFSRQLILGGVQQDRSRISYWGKSQALNVLDCTPLQGTGKSTQQPGDKSIIDRLRADQGCNAIIIGRKHLIAGSQESYASILFLHILVCDYLV